MMAASYNSMARGSKRRQMGCSQHNLNNPGGGGNVSSTHLNATGYHHPVPTRLIAHPTKHLEASRSFHTFQRQESNTSFHSTHSAPNQHLPGQLGAANGGCGLMPVRVPQTTTPSSIP